MHQREEIEKIYNTPANLRLKHIAIGVICIAIILMGIAAILIDDISDTMLLVMRGCAGLCAIIFVIIVGILTYRVNNTYIKSSTQSNLIKNAKIMDKLELTRKIAEELNEEIGLTTIFIYPNKDKEITLTSSKFGGLPYWDDSLPYPTDNKGNKLKLLAQFNLGEIAEACHSCGGLLPESGMLQFFILPEKDCFYGSDLDDYTNNNLFRGIYHPSINPEITVEDILDLDIPTASASENDYEPISGEIGLDFDIEKKASIEQDGFKDKFIAKARAYGWKLENEDDGSEDIEDLCDCLDEDVYSELFDCSSYDGSCLLGYPFFTQYDPRIDDERYSEYDTQLFQMGSYQDEDEDETDFIAMWGDMGIAHFFINRDKLIEKDFSDIMYYWDCY